MAGRKYVVVGQSHRNGYVLRGRRLQDGGAAEKASCLIIELANFGPFDPLWAVMSFIEGYTADLIRVVSIFLNLTTSNFTSHMQFPFRCYCKVLP